MGEEGKEAKEFVEKSLDKRAYGVLFSKTLDQMFIVATDDVLPNIQVVFPGRLLPQTITSTTEVIKFFDDKDNKVC